MPNAASIAVVAVAISLAWPGGAALAIDDKPTIEQVLHAWRARQSKAVVVRVEMSCEQTMPKGSLTRKLRGSEFATGPGPGALDPPLDVAIKGASRLDLCGVKMRYSYDGKRWDSGGGVLCDFGYSDMFDGKLFKFYNKFYGPKYDYSFGHVGKADRSESALQFSLMPLMWAFRGDHKQYFHRLGQFTATGRSHGVNGRTCWELSRRAEDEDKSEVLYVDPDRAFSVVRMAVVKAGKPTWQLDVSYQPDKTVGWAPHIWESVIRVGPDNTVVDRERRTVTNYVIGGAVDQGGFDFSFPPGTRVMDDAGGLNVQYVIREDGTKGASIPSRLAPSYEELKRAGQGPR